MTPQYSDSIYNREPMRRAFRILIACCITNFIILFLSTESPIAPYLFGLFFLMMLTYGIVVFSMERKARCRLCQSKLQFTHLNGPSELYKIIDSTEVSKAIKEKALKCRSSSSTRDTQMYYAECPSCEKRALISLGIGS